MIKFIACWSVISIIFFIYRMDDKYRKAKWWDYAIGLPALTICYIVGSFFVVKELL